MIFSVNFGQGKKAINSLARFMSNSHHRNSYCQMGKKPFLIGVSGGTASGKSTVCEKIIERLGQYNMDQQQRQVVCISQDSFYRELNPAESAKALLGQFNFDHPDAFDYDLILKTLKTITLGEPCDIPVYDFMTNSRVNDSFVTIYPADVVLFEGILVFYTSEVRNMFDMKLFVDTDADTRLARRVLRDIRDRGRDLNKVLLQYTSLVKPAFEEFCLPTKKFADVIIPRGAENTVAIELIVQHIQDILRSRIEAAVVAAPSGRKRAVNFQISPEEEPAPSRDFSRMRQNSEPALSRPH